MRRTFRRYLQSAANAVSREGEIDPTPEFVGDEIANDLQSKPTCVGSLDSRGPRLFPFNVNSATRTSVQRTVPTHGDAPIADRKCTVLCGIGCQLVQHR